MKLRFRENSLRFRVNQPEVQRLASGAALREELYFPGETRIAYMLEPANVRAAEASFQDGIIRITAPHSELNHWADGDSIGVYFDLPANGRMLKIAIEKDLECLEGPPEEDDPDAFPRQAPKNC